MIQITLKQLAEITKGEIIAGRSCNTESLISQISIDSRGLVNSSACLFVAIRGERHNGHHYIDSLYYRGVRFFLISEDVQQESYTDASFVKVEDSLKAFQQLAAFHRSQFNYPLVAITGSNGKTIIKEWLYALLHKKLKLIRSPKSYNSQVGVPLSLFNMEAYHQLAIVEAGISEPNEMRLLEEMIRPQVGIFTNIGQAHQLNFASKEEKILEKLQLFKDCKMLIYSADDALLSHCIEENLDAKQLFSWSANKENKKAKLCFNAEKQEGLTKISFNWEAVNYSVLVPFVGASSLENAFHCLAFILYMGYADADVFKAFATLQAVAMRLELKEGANDSLLISDFYNSDINALEIALKFQESKSAGKDKCLILSDIEQTELSDLQLAQSLVRLIKPFAIQKLILIGEKLGGYKEYFPLGTLFFKDTASFVLQTKAIDFRNCCVLLKGARHFHFEEIEACLIKKHHQTQLEIDLDALVANLNRYRSKINEGTKIMVMVKAFSYGNGTIEIARCLEYNKVDYLAVAVADEGIELRRAGIQMPIVVMNPEKHSFQSIIRYRLEPNIYSLQQFNDFKDVAARLAVRKFPIHIKVETGMHRLGFDNVDELQSLLNSIKEDDALQVSSVFSHLAGSDSHELDSFTSLQAERFAGFCKIVQSYFPKVVCHILNSAGIERFPHYQFNMVRLGIGLYGYAPFKSIKSEVVASWYSTISQIKKVPTGETVGYSRRGELAKDSLIAIIPVGYADGYSRRLSNGVGRVWINGAEYPIIGNVCMDMCMIDITGATLEEGTRVELMGEHITMQRIAEWMDTIPYEVLTGISQRVPRLYLQD